MKTKTQKKNLLFINQNRGLIDLDPFFQRSSVWNETKKITFIDTIMRGWGIPKIYLAAYHNGAKEVYKYECLDGKQRLTTIFDFLDGNFKIKIDNKEKSYEELSVKEKERLSKYIIDIEEVSDFDQADLAELFQRLQAGTVLNTSEKLKAVPGEMSEFVFKISNHNLFKTKILSKGKRNPHLAHAAQATLLTVKNSINSLKFKDLADFLHHYKKFNTKGAEAKKVKFIMDYLDKAFNVDEARKIFINRAIFVSYFYFVSYLMLRGNISTLDSTIKSFFIRFAADLASSSNSKKTDDYTADLKEFQFNVVQGADSSSSIKKRHDILLRSFVSFSKKATQFINIKTPLENFEEIYRKKLALYEGEHKNLNVALLGIGCKSKVVVARNKNEIEEALPVYIRHSNEHPSKARSYKYTPEDLLYSISYLQKV